MSRVLPADAGVFRPPGLSMTTRSSPPRRRGGVPLVLCVGLIYMASSPPTRGCSEVAEFLGRKAPSSPPTRGCSAVLGQPATPPVVLPADAGVFRAHGGSCGRRIGPPRRRGGVPRTSGSIRRSFWSSPPTRGCCGHRPPDPGDHGVLPADAGVFRGPSPHRFCGSRPPRRRGGVPKVTAASVAAYLSSPPTRGCSVPSSQTQGRRTVLPADAGCSVGRGAHAAWSSVLPADAGVFRPVRRTPGSRPCPPRRRGGVPSVGGAWYGQATSSPPTRGCSAGSIRPAHDRRVLPADAGVFRPTPRGHQSVSRPPRRRGGVPKAAGVDLPRTSSSPSTRGCSGIPDPHDGRERVLPADAGVFRSRRGAGAGGCRPPRRRGGVPYIKEMSAALRGSSPPTRGCYGDRGPPGPVPAVLPADAGVFRRRGRVRGWRHGPPRRRGGVPILGAVALVLTMSSPPTRGVPCPHVMPVRLWPSSPPTRGPYRGPAMPSSSSVLPANARVLRSPGKALGAGGDPPCGRGGVPLRGRQSSQPLPSFPPTRRQAGPGATRQLAAATGRPSGVHSVPTKIRAIRGPAAYGLAA